MHTPAPPPSLEPVTSPVPAGPGTAGATPERSGARTAHGAPAPGTTLGEHRLLHVIGEGGMGVVYLALDAEQHAVALKVLRPHIAGDPYARQRLDREVSTLARVRSPHVAEVLGADVSGQWPYLVTRYVPGRPLDAVVAADGPLTGRALHELGHGLAEALAAIHAAGVVHRDLKPGNVLLVDGRPVVIDFGIAHVADDVRLTSTGLVMGTPGYLSPEVVGGGAVSPATDWWGWAATVAFAATGRPPFGRGPMEVVLDRVRRGDADLAGLPPELQRLLSAALAINPAHRPQPQELLAGLERACREAGESRPVVEPVADPRAGSGGAATRDASAATPAPAVLPPPAPAVGAPDDESTRVVPVDERSPFESLTGLAAGSSAGWAASGGDFEPRREGPRGVDPRDAAVLREAALRESEAETPAERTSVLPALRQHPPAQPPGPAHTAGPAQGWGARGTEQPTSAMPAVQQYPGPQHPPQYPGPQHPAPQHPAPQHPAAQYPQRYPAAPYPAGQGGGWGPPAPWPPPAAPGHGPSAAQPTGAHPAGAVPRSAAPAGHAPGREGRAVSRARTGTLLVALLALVGVFAVAPTAACLISLVGASVARTVDRSRATLHRRREVAGPRPSDGFAVAVSVPWNALRAVVSTVVAAVVPALVGVSTLFLAGLLTGGGPDASLSLALGGLAAVLTAWWGPGSRSLQRGTRAVLRGVTRGEREAGVVIAVLGLLALSALFMVGQGAEPDWRPLTGSPISWF